MTFRAKYTRTVFFPYRLPMDHRSEFAAVLLILAEYAWLQDISRYGPQVVIPGVCFEELLSR